jgi:hypothetical protein
MFAGEEAEAARNDEGVVGTVVERSAPFAPLLLSPLVLPLLLLLLGFVLPAAEEEEEEEEAAAAFDLALALVGTTGEAGVTATVGMVRPGAVFCTEGGACFLLPAFVLLVLLLSEVVLLLFIPKLVRVAFNCSFSACKRTFRAARLVSSACNPAISTRCVSLPIIASSSITPSFAFADL